MYYSRRCYILNKYFKVEYLFFIICISFLLYQSIDLFILFMSGKTVTNISVGNIRNTSLPAITVCPGQLDFSRMSLSNENVTILYKEYLKMIENANRSRISDIEKDIIDIYFKAVLIYFYYKEDNIEIQDILKNIPPYINKMNESTLTSLFIESSAYGKIDQDLIKYEDEYNSNYIMKSQTNGKSLDFER